MLQERVHGVGELAPRRVHAGAIQLRGDAHHVHLVTALHLADERAEEVAAEVRPASPEQLEQIVFQVPECRLHLPEL
jgi:hypothetical protein